MLHPKDRGGPKVTLPSSNDNINFQHPTNWHWVYAVDSLNDVLLLLRRDGTVVRANKALEHWDICSVTSAPGLNFHELLHGNCSDPTCYISNLWYRMTRYLEGKGKVEQEVKDDILDRWLHVSIEALPTPDERCEERQNPPYALFFIRDISRLRHQKEMDDRRTRFEAFNVILRGLAHEIGNPLAAMRTTVEVLKESIDIFPPEKVQAYLDRVVEGTERLQAIVDRTLRSQYLPQLKLTAFSLRKIILRMFHLFEDEMAALGINFTHKPPPESNDVAIFLDLTAAEEVIVNLLKNSKEACRQGDAIQLTYEIEQETVKIHIRDSGQGMTQSELTSLFLPLFSGKPGGLGLGLAYSNYLMSKMRGALGVESLPGEGTVITLSFTRV